MCLRRWLIPVVIAILLCAAGLCLLCSGAIMTTTPSGQAACGQLRIPGAEISAELYRAHADCGCCALGLYNGGRILARAEDADWQAVDVGDWMYIRQEDGPGLVLECVAMGRCLSMGGRLIGAQRLLGHPGEVLLCVSAGCWPIVIVYRWTIL